MVILLINGNSSPDDFNKPEIREIIKTTCPKLVVAAVRIVEGMELTRSDKF